MFKKSLIIFTIILSAFLSSFSVSTASVFAEDEQQTSENKTTNNFGITSNCETTFLGFTPWSCGVDINNQETLKTGIWKIAVNIFIDLTIAASYLVLGYVIYGGYVYISSAGDPNKVAKGKKTLTQAFIGLAIVMSANIIMSSIRIALVGNEGNIGNCVSDAGCVNPNDMITNLIQWVIGIAGVVAVIFIVYGGIAYTTASGDPTKVKQAKKIILYALIGLVIVALAEVITAFVSKTIRDANQNAQINQTIISKEITHENKFS